MGIWKLLEGVYPSSAEAKAPGGIWKVSRAQVRRSLGRPMGLLPVGSEELSSGHPPKMNLHLSLNIAAFRIFYMNPQRPTQEGK